MSLSKAKEIKRTPPISILKRLTGPLTSKLTLVVTYGPEQATHNFSGRACRCGAGSSRPHGQTTQNVNPQDARYVAGVTAVS